MPDFAQFSPFLNGSIFLVAAVAVWLAGTRITGYANAISAKTGIGQAAIGMLLLAGITSLPEIGVTITSAARGAADLALNNLFGSIALQVAILAAADFLIARRALTSTLPDPSVLLQGALNILLLAVVTAGMTVGDIPIIGIGAWAWVSLLAYAFSVWILAQTQGQRPWLAASHGKVDVQLEEQQKKAEEQASHAFETLSLAGLAWRTAALALVILVAGYFLSLTGDALATQTGLGGSFVGFAFLALATSLPELSTTIAAVRSGLYTLALSDIFGTNLINVGLVFVIDAVAPGDPVLAQVDSFAAFGALLAIALTALYLVGMAERRDRTILRLGLDSTAVLACYAVGLVILFFLR